jgi:hypothetical protein
MKIQTPQSTQSLYEQDFQLWLETTIRQLSSGHYSAVDWENLLEELQGMTKSDKRALMSLLTRLFEHLLKLAYWESEREYNQRGWKGEILNFRVQIKTLLEDSPSLKTYLAEIFPRCYRDAVKITVQVTGLPPKTFPGTPIATLEQILDENWLPIETNNSFS